MSLKLEIATVGTTGKRVAIPIKDRVASPARPALAAVHIPQRRSNLTVTVLMRVITVFLRLNCAVAAPAPIGMGVCCAAERQGRHCG